MRVHAWFIWAAHSVESYNCFDVRYLVGWSFCRCLFCRSVSVNVGSLFGVGRNVRIRALHLIITHTHTSPITPYWRTALALRLLLLPSTHSAAVCVTDGDARETVWIWCVWARSSLCSTRRNSLVAQRAAAWFPLGCTRAGNITHKYTPCMSIYDDDDDEPSRDAAAVAAYALICSSTVSHHPV